MSADLFVFAGEKSADVHGEGVLRALKARYPHLRITGVGGPCMRKVGMQTILQMEEFQVMGFLDVFFSLPSLIRHFYTVVRSIEATCPKLVFTIDYPGFNLRLARTLRKRGFTGKICHYICPSVWAWGKKRIPFMASVFDMLLSILPFEKQLFAHTPLDVHYVGHPLIAKIHNYFYKPLLLPPQKKILALFPGSRKKEIERNLPIQLRVCKKFRDLHLAISLSEQRFAPLIHAIAKAEWVSSEQQISLIPGDYTYELMRIAHCAVAKSGTVTLELALHRTPTLVTYAITPLDLFIARDLLRIRLPYYCLANIIANKSVFPELIGPHFTEENLSAQLKQMMDPSHYEQCKRNCDIVRAALGQQNASIEAANYLSLLL